MLNSFTNRKHCVISQGNRIQRYYVPQNQDLFPSRLPRMPPSRSHCDPPQISTSLEKKKVKKKPFHFSHTSNCIKSLKCQSECKASICDDNPTMCKYTQHHSKFEAGVHHVSESLKLQCKFKAAVSDVSKAI